MATLFGMLAASAEVTSQKAPGPPLLRNVVIDALRDVDWQVRHAAASLVEAFGDRHHLNALRGALADERPEVSRIAWRAYLSIQPAEVERGIRWVADSDTWDDVGLLIRVLRSLVRPEHVGLLTAELERAKSPHAQYALLSLLVAAGAKVSERADAYARRCVTEEQILNASALLPLLPDTPEHRERIEQWLGEQDAVVRHRCAAWLRSHGTTGPLVEQHVIPDYVEPDVYAAESRQAALALGGDWMPTTRAAVLDTVSKARIVLVGDSHGSKCIADLAVDCCAASLAAGERGKVAFGYEPPIEMFFGLVKPRAVALGLVAVPLEPVENMPSLSLRARDAAITAEIQTWLDRSSNHKLVALYGWNHILGRDHVDVPGAVRILTCPPAAGLMQHIRAESLAKGVLAADDDRWFVHRVKPLTFFVICDDRTWCPDTRPAFTAWLAEKLRE